MFKKINRLLSFTFLLSSLILLFGPIQAKQSMQPKIDQDYHVDPGDRIRFFVQYDDSWNPEYGYGIITSWGHYGHDPDTWYILTAGHVTPNVGSWAEVLDGYGNWVNIGHVEYLMYNGADQDYGMVRITNNDVVNWRSYSFEHGGQIYYWWNYARSDQEYDTWRNNFYIRTGTTNALLQLTYEGVIENVNRFPLHTFSIGWPGTPVPGVGDSGSPVFYYDENLQQNILAGIFAGRNFYADGAVLYFFTPTWYLVDQMNFIPYTMNGGC